MTRTNDAGSGSEAGEGKVAVLSGGAGALAGATAEAFASHGWQLVLLARAAHVEELEQRFGRADVVALDLTVGTAVADAVSDILDRHGQVDAMLNLAGGFAMSASDETSDDALTHMLDLNLRTAFVPTRAVVPSMIARGDGFVLGVSAKAALVGGRRTTAYGAAKGAVTGYFRNLRAELEPHGIGVSLLFPMGTLDTEANRESMPNADPKGFIDLGRVAEAIHFLATRTRRDRIAELQITSS